MEMKKVLALVAAAGILAAASTSFALVAGGKHDMRTGSSAVLTGGTKAAAGTQICVYCHAPHGAYSALPLWNRSQPTNAASFILYSNSGMANTTYKTGFTSDSPSLFCMSCHDGVTSVNAVKNVPPAATGALATGMVGGDGALGNGTLNIGNSAANTGHVTHPINFAVTNTTSQNDLWNVNADGTMGNAGSLGSTTVGSSLMLPLYAVARTGSITVKNSVECSSCHSVHNYDNSPFLRATMAASALCLGCHNK